MTISLVIRLVSLTTESSCIIDVCTSCGYQRLKVNSKLCILPDQYILDVLLPETGIY